MEVLVTISGLVTSVTTTLHNCMRTVREPTPSTLQPLLVGPSTSKLGIHRHFAMRWSIELLTRSSAQDLQCPGECHTPRVNRVSLRNAVYDTEMFTFAHAILVVPLYVLNRTHIGETFLYANSSVLPSAFEPSTHLPLISEKNN